MGKYSGMYFEEVVALVTKDGIVDDDEAEELAEYIYDVERVDAEVPKVDLSVLNFVVAIDTATQHMSGHSDMWSELYTEVVADYVFSGEDIWLIEAGEAEAAQLVAAWGGDGGFSLCARAAAECIRFIAEDNLPEVLETFLISRGV